MNILFHTTTAFTAAVILSDTKKVSKGKKIVNTLIIGILAFILGVISHGALDYIPHCYPLNAKIDSITSIILMLSVLILLKPGFRIIVGLAFVGGVFPDLVDLLPSIFNKYLGVNLPIFGKFFPWHWPQYSGSMSNENCTISTINISLLLLVSVIICYSRRDDLLNMFKRKSVDRNTD